jgi:hypothetical protein
MLAKPQLTVLTPAVPEIVYRDSVVTSLDRAAPFPISQACCRGTFGVQWPDKTTNWTSAFRLAIVSREPDAHVDEFRALDRDDE